MTVVVPALYTGCNRVRRVGSCVRIAIADTEERSMASRLAAILKGSGVGEKQDDVYANRRAELDAQFRALPLAGDAAYWRHIESADKDSALPLEVLVRCVRERTAAGAIDDAMRIFEAILRRAQSPVERWTLKVARQARSGMKPELREDLAQECYEKLWKELTDDGPTFLAVHFTSAFGHLCQHVAHDTMEKAGEWRRKGVATPTRIPRAETESIEAKPKGEDDVPLVGQITDMRVHNAFDQAELSDLFDLVMKLPLDQRTIILDRFWDGRSQEETATKLGISDRMVRYRLKLILHDLGVRYQGGEEDNHA